VVQKLPAGHIKVSGVAIFAPVILKSALANAEESRRSKSTGGALPMLDTKDSTAVAVKYVENAAKSTTSKGNKCATCSFYGKKENRNGKEVGTCTIFQGKLVYGNGFCNSWNKKQG